MREVNKVEGEGAVSGHSCSKAHPQPGQLHLLLDSFLELPK